MNIGAFRTFICWRTWNTACSAWINRSMCLDTNRIVRSASLLPLPGEMTSVPKLRAARIATRNNNLKLQSSDMLYAIALFRLRIWKSGGQRMWVQRGVENGIHLLLKCTWRQRGGKELLNGRWLNIKRETLHNTHICLYCDNGTEGIRKFCREDNIWVRKQNEGNITKVQEESGQRL
jgi:hypothetical protein